MKYTFGTSSQARERLREIALFFNPLASELIKGHITSKPALALDIGCGPGFTTDMLFHAAQPEKTIGIDNSRQFIRGARRMFPQYSFLEHDALSLPFPVRADVVYVRFVLSHLSEPVEVINRWTTQLTPGGIAFIDEVEKVETDIAAFATYLSVNEAIVASQGASLFVGGEIARGTYEADVLGNECDVLRVPDSQAATWFLPNVKTIWRNNPIVSGRLERSEIRAIEAELARFVISKSLESRITWKMRRLVLRRKICG